MKTLENVCGFCAGVAAYAWTKRSVMGYTYMQNGRLVKMGVKLIAMSVGVEVGKRVKKRVEKICEAVKEAATADLEEEEWEED